jgi:hypothetical protein
MPSSMPPAALRGGGALVHECWGDNVYSDRTLESGAEFQYIGCRRLG